MFKRALRKLLQLDQPISPRSDAEIAAEVERNYHWNFAVNLISGAIFWFGFHFASSSTIVPLFISKLTSSTLAIGFVAVLAQGGWFLPQLFTANAVEQLARKKPVVVNLGLFVERLPWWIPVITALLAARSSSLALGLFFIGYTWREFGAGAVATAWQDLIARCFPVDRRGRFFGTTTFVGTSIGTIGAFFGAWLLKAFPFPYNFVYIFAIAAFSVTLGWGVMAMTREPLQPLTASRQSNREYWAKLPALLRGDHNFRRFLIARSLLALGNMGAGFLVVAAIRRWQIPDSTVGIYTAALLLGQTAGNLLFGLLADRFGHKLSLELGSLAAFLSFLLAWLAPAATWYYAVFALMGIYLGAVIVSGILVIMEFCAPPRRPTYAGLANTIVGLVVVVAPLLGAWLAHISYSWLFALSAGISLVALILMRWWVQEPRWAEVRERMAMVDGRG